MVSVWVAMLRLARSRWAAQLSGIVLRAVGFDSVVESVVRRSPAAGLSCARVSAFTAVNRTVPRGQEEDSTAQLYLPGDSLGKLHSASPNFFSR